MARTNDPHSATSQFFINTVDNDFSKYLFKQTGLLLSEEVATRIEISLKLNNIDNQSVNYQDYKCFLMEIFDDKYILLI